MSTVAQDLVVAAIGRSSKNKGEILANNASELLALIARLQQAAFSLAATVNYTVFAGFLDVAAQAESGGPEDVGWLVPPDAECVFRIERLHTTEGGTGGKGDQITEVMFDDRAAEPGKPCVYRLGGIYLPAGNAPDPTGGDIRFYYSRVPVAPTTIDDTLDAQWPDRFDNLLITQIALYLAKKDGRTDEVTWLATEETEWKAQFTAWLGRPSVNVVTRKGLTRRIPNPVVQPAGAGEPS